MKEHIVLSVQPEYKVTGLPYWGDLIKKPQLTADDFIPDVKKIFSRYHLPALYTSEYKPLGSTWTNDEVVSGLDKVYRIILKENKSIPPALLHDIKLLPYVVKVEKVDVGTSDLPPVAYSQALPAFDSTTQILLSQAHMFSEGHPDIKIAVLDTGVFTKHPEFKDSILPGMDFVDIIDGADKFVGDYLGLDTIPDDDVGHGTHVCGILAAKGIKIQKGVVPNCKIIPVRVLGALRQDGKVVGAGLVDNINNGIKWAVDQGADIINMSLGIKHTGGGLPHEEVIRYAHKKGVSIVAASGNDGTNDLYYPGALPGVIAVGAVDQTDSVAGFSTFGRHVSFVAPGTNIMSTYPENKYAISSGTSQAAPFVAGAIALLKSFARKFNRPLNDSQVKFILKHTSDKLTTRLKDLRSGYGRINLLDAVKLLKYKLEM